MPCSALTGRLHVFPSDTVELFGLGENLDGNQPSLSVVVTPEGGAPGAAIALDPLGGERYGYTFTPQNLPDGSYSLSVSGTVRGEVPVDVSPEALNILVDRVAPTLNFISPAADGVFQDVEPITPGTQSQISLEACGVAGESLTIDSVPALPGFPQIVEVPADGECAQIVLNPVTVPLGPVSFKRPSPIGAASPRKQTLLRRFHRRIPRLESPCRKRVQT